MPTILITGANRGLGLGLTNGGREREGAAAVRPAASGTTGQRIPDFSAIALDDNDPVIIDLTDPAGTSIDQLTINLTPVPASLARSTVG